MTETEFETYQEGVQAEVIRELAATMSESEARAQARQGMTQHLPHGLATVGHDLVIAEEAEQPVGNAWIGPEPYGGNGAWLFDINVYPHVRRRGFGTAILEAAEAWVLTSGKQRLGLNVFGGNEPAIALYRRAGYSVTSQHMVKQLP